MAREYLIATAMPYSAAADADFHVSLFLAPTIRSDAESRLDDWALFPDWTASVARRLSIVLSDQAGTITCQPLLDIVEPDLWPRIFPPDTPVKSVDVPDWSSRKWRSFAARRVHEIARAVHVATILADPARPPSPDAHPLAEPLERLIASDELYRIEGSGRIRRQVYDESVATRAWDRIVEAGESLEAVEKRIAAEPDWLRRIALELHRCRRFYERPENEDKYWTDTVPGTPPPELPRNMPEFHQRCAALGDHPALLRRLGLVIDLKVDDPERLRSSAWLSANLVLDDAPAFCRATRVQCESSDETFTAVPRSADWARGALRLGDTERFAVLTLDTDGSAIKADRFLWTLPRLRALKANQDPVNAATPSLRSPGFTIAADGLAARTQANLGRQRGLAEELEADRIPPLDAEDVIRGLRVEVWDDHSDRWYSLHARLSHASLSGGDTIYSDLAEQGFIQGTAAHENPRAAASPIHVHEALFGWEGWSLSAPRPGKRVRHEDGAEIVEPVPAPAAADAPDPFEVSTQVHPGTLPRLRYGRAYAFRAWAVDLAGNSRPHALNPPPIPPIDPEGPLGRIAPPPEPADFAREALAGATRSVIARRPLAKGASNEDDSAIDAPILDHIRARRAARLAGVISGAPADRTSLLAAAFADALATGSGPLRLGPEPRSTALPAVAASQLALLHPDRQVDASRVQAALDTVTAPQPFLRWEPILSPTIVPRRRYTEGESLRVLVIRSGVSQDDTSLALSIANPADYAQSAGLAVPQCDYHATSERHLAPPSRSQMEAEFHGMFDAAIGSQAAADHQAMLAWALRENGTFNDLSRADPDTPGVRLPQPGVSIVSVGRPSEALKALPLAPGEPPAPGQTVVHDVDAVALPFLPDPMARGVAIRFPAAGLDPALPFPYGTEGFTADYGGAWPEREPYRLVLQGGENLSTAVADRVITMTLPPGDMQTIQVASALPRDGLRLLGPWESLPAALRDDPDVAEAAADGALWGLSPFEECVLVHAVDRPIEMPRPVRIIPIRSEGATSVTLAGAVDLHGPSTGTLSAEAIWSEPVDDLSLPLPQNRDGQAIAFQTIVRPYEDIALLGAIDLELPLPDLGPVGIHKAVQQFGDTRHRRVTYRLRASTRFREYFQPALIASSTDVPLDDGQSVISAPFTIAIPSSARPAAPGVHSVIPLFRWSDENEPEQPMARRRTRRAGVRIYLERPWYSSGAGELLGLLLATTGDDTLYPAGKDGSSFPFVSQWGADPVWSAATVERRAIPLLRFDNLLREGGLDDRDEAARPVGPARQFPLAAIAGRPVVSVLGYTPQFNADRALWYVDVAIDPGAQFWPFLRLAVCRYQPDSITDCHLSPPVQCDFVQLPPERAASVSRTDDRRVRVVVTGPVGVRGVTGDEPISPAAIDRNRRMIARLQRRHPAIQSDLGWKTIAVARLKVRGQRMDGHLASWVGELDAGDTIYLATPPSTDSDWRVAIEEWELLEADPAQGRVRPAARPVPRTETRLIYADHIHL